MFEYKYDIFILLYFISIINVNNINDNMLFFNNNNINIYYFKSKSLTCIHFMY